MPPVGPSLARFFFLPSYGYTHLLTFLGIRKGYDRIDETVYVGILPTIAMQKYLIEHEKIDAVVSMNEDYELTYVSDQNLWTKHQIQHLRLPTVDFSNPQVENLFHGVEFLRTIRQEKKTAYIHCKAGRQRSANLAACYLIDSYGMTPEAAARYILSIRPSTIFRAREIARLHEFVELLRKEYQKKQEESKMNVQSAKQRNAYLQKINENLTSFFPMMEKFDRTLEEFSQVVNGATVHINDIERILGNNEDEDEDEQMMLEDDQELVAGEKLCELNENLNVSIREIRRLWSTLEKQSLAISKSVDQSPKLIRLFLDTTKNDPDLNNPSLRSEITHLSDQFSIIGQFYYELCLEIQANLLDLSNIKAMKHLASILDLLSARSTSISVPLQIIRQIQIKLI